jgi:hypothetical protein
VLKREGRKRKRSRERKRWAAGKIKQEEHQDKGEQRGRTSGILQGHIHNFRNLQGPVRKTKFPVDLKP